MDEIERKCVKCRELKPIDEFYKIMVPGRPSPYYRRVCKACMREERREYYEKEKK